MGIKGFRPTAESENLDWKSTEPKVKKGATTLNRVEGPFFTLNDYGSWS